MTDPTAGSDAPPPLREGDLLTVRIETIDDAGRGVSDQGLTLPGAFPGESASARVVHLSRHRGDGNRHRGAGKLVSLEERHPQRRIPPCPNSRRPLQPDHPGRCDGCALMAVDEAAQRSFVKEHLRSAYGLTVDEVHSATEPFGYRWSSKRIAFGGAGRLQLGSWQRASHRPASMEGCLVDHPRITAAFDELQRVAQELAIAAYDERSSSGLVRYVWAKTDGDRVLLTLVCATDERESILELAKGLRRSHGVTLSIHAGNDNAMRGSAPEPLVGLDSLQVPFGEAIGSVTVGAGGFLQPNPQVVQRIYRALTHGADGSEMAGSLAFDLYAGSGLTTRLLRKRFTQVIACESDPTVASRDCRVQTTQALLAEYRGPAPELVVANPPRAGLKAKVCAALASLAPERIHIMSCGPRALAADLKRLSEGYRVERIEAWDTLPQTPHVELVAWLTKR